MPKEFEVVKDEAGQLLPRMKQPTLRDLIIEIGDSRLFPWFNQIQAAVAADKDAISANGFHDSDAGPSSGDAGRSRFRRLVDLFVQIGANLGPIECLPLIQHPFFVALKEGAPHLLLSSVDADRVLVLSTSSGSWMMFSRSFVEGLPPLALKPTVEAVSTMTGAGSYHLEIKRFRIGFADERYDAVAVWDGLKRS